MLILYPAWCDDSLLRALFLWVDPRPLRSSFCLLAAGFLGHMSSYGRAWLFLHRQRGAC